MRGLLIAALVVGALIGGLLLLRSSRNVGMPGPDVLDRAKRRAAELDAAERRDEDQER